MPIRSSVLLSYALDITGTMAIRTRSEAMRHLDEMFGPPDFEIHRGVEERNSHETSHIHLIEGIVYCNRLDTHSNNHSWRSRFSYTCLVYL